MFYIVIKRIFYQSLGKKKVVAETGAGQHGVALATAAALFGLKCEVGYILHSTNTKFKKQHILDRSTWEPYVRRHNKMRLHFEPIHRWIWPKKPLMLLG